MDWQPIETAPKDVEVLLYFPCIRATPQARTGARPMMRVDHVWNWDTGPRYATHWMPLPDPPSTP